MKKFLAFSLIGSACVIFIFFVHGRYFPVIRPKGSAMPVEVTASKPKEAGSDVPLADESAPILSEEGAAAAHPPEIGGDALSDVPFLPQAPTGKWREPVFQNGCEEASALMAIFWAEERPLPSNGIERESLIRTMASDIERKYGTSHDTSISDLARFLEGRSAALSVAALTDVSPADIREALLSGYGMIVPIDGRVLKNPHYTAPGPERHMLLAIGYDRATGEIVTNDPGTRYGRGYRYSESVFYRAIRDYPTGDGLPTVGAAKNVLLVRRR